MRTEEQGPSAQICDVEECHYAAVWGTSRCIVHAEPVHDDCDSDCRCYFTRYNGVYGNRWVA